MSKKANLFSAARIIAPVLLLVIVIASSVAVSNAGDLVDGVQVVTFTTREGEVNIYVPDDMAAGDTISAAIISVPNGATYEAQLNNLSLLNKYVVQVGGQSFYVSEQSFTFNVPANMYGSSVKFTLRDEERREYSSSSLPVKRRAYDVIRPETPGPIDYKSPMIGQTGRPVEIEGPFDGDFKTTDLKIGGVEAEKLAESPRKLVVDTPPEVEGSTELELTESSVVVRRPFTNLKVLKIGEGGAVPVNNIARRKDLTVNTEPLDTRDPAVATGADGQLPADGEDFVPTQRLSFSSVEAEPVSPASVSGKPYNDKASILDAQLGAAITGGTEYAYAAVPVNPGDNVSGPVKAEKPDAAETYEIAETLRETETAVLPQDNSNVTAGAASDAGSKAEADSPEAKGWNSESDRLKASGEKARILDTQMLAVLMDTHSPVHTGIESNIIAPAPIDVESAKGYYTVQVASFKKEFDADVLSGKLKEKGYQSYVVPADIPGRGKWYRVRIGKFESKREAAVFGYQLKITEPMVRDIFVALID